MLCQVRLKGVATTNTLLGPSRLVFFGEDLLLALVVISCEQCKTKSTDGPKTEVWKCDWSLTKEAEERDSDDDFLLIY